MIYILGALTQPPDMTNGDLALKALNFTLTSAFSILVIWLVVRILNEK